MSIIKNTKSESVKLDGKTLVVKNIFETSSSTLTRCEAVYLISALYVEFKIKAGERHE